jgi:hypothetical protein
MFQLSDDQRAYLAALPLTERLAEELRRGEVLLAAGASAGPYHTATGWSGWAVFIGPTRDLETEDLTWVAERFLDTIGTVAAVALLRARQEARAQ